MQQQRTGGSDNGQNVPAVVETTSIPSASLLDSMIQAQQRTLPDAQRFPQGENPEWFDKACIGRAFLITSEVRISREETKEFTNKSGVKDKIGAHDIAQLTIRFVNFDTREVGPVCQAKWGGTYLVNQLKRLTANELYTRIWTLARNPNMPASKYGHPIMLATYQPGVDRPDDEAALYEQEHDSGPSSARRAASLSSGERASVTQNGITAEELQRRTNALAGVQAGDSIDDAWTKISEHGA